MNRNSLRSSSHVQGGFSRQLEFRPHSPYQFGKLNRVNLAPPLPLLIPTSWINQIKKLSKIFNYMIQSRGTTNFNSLQLHDQLLLGSQPRCN